ncbi:hypothetical protein [Phenylobacterium sp.]|uniref:hypothetical protein n=1 Tax=Phenylobacterium sp. TaxID=1871053 RepID=UPI0035B03DC9
MISTKRPHKHMPRKLIVSAKRADRERFQRLADQGEIPTRAVVPLATVFAAARRAQVEIGPGHLPLDAIFAAFPEDYRRNWLAKQPR